MTEGWDNLRIPRPRFSPSGAVPRPRPGNEPDTRDQFDGLAALIAIAERQDAARRAAAAGLPVPPRPPQQKSGQPGDQLAGLLADIEAARHRQPGRD